MEVQALPHFGYMSVHMNENATVMSQVIIVYDLFRLQTYFTNSFAISMG